MKQLLLLLLTCCCAFAIEAPTITGIVAQSNTTVRLTWRSNDTTGQGFYILRVDPYTSTARRIDTLSAVDTAYTDTVLPGEIYYYGVSAFSGTTYSPVTKYASVQMPGLKRLLLAPTLAGLWDTATTSVRLDIIDQSTAETGFRILRAENFGLFSERTVILSDNPESVDTVTFIDNLANAGTWYTYRVIVYDRLGQDSSEASVYACLKRTARPAEKVVPGVKFGSFPIRYGGWALKQGDTICVQQDSLPYDSCTLIDVSKPEKPIFAGRIANSVPRRMQEPQTYTSLGNMLLYRNRDSMVAYCFSKGTIDSVSSVSIQHLTRAQPPQISSIGEVVGSFNNNVVLTRCDDSYKYTIYDTYFYSPDKLVPLGRFMKSKEGYCNKLSLVLFSAGQVYDHLIQGHETSVDSKAGSDPGCVLDSLSPEMQFYYSCDFSFDPRKPEQRSSNTAPDTSLKEYNGCISSDYRIQKSKALFIDSSESVLYLFDDAELSVYTYALTTGSSPHPHNSVHPDFGLRLRYTAGSRTLHIGYNGVHDNASMAVRLFSLKGVLLLTRQIEPGSGVDLPNGIGGMVLVRVDAASQRAYGKIMVAR